MSAAKNTCQAPHLRTGRQGEDLAERRLKARGLRILERNFRTRHGELDLVCRAGDTLVFVEVKTRKAGSRAEPHQALTPAKRVRLARAAAEYLSARGGWDRPCRFDLVEVVAPGTPDEAVRHIENAFALDGAEAGAGGWQPW
ncbi:MAG: YraN family protein [Thermodesulfobacteriota bacterium]